MSTMETQKQQLDIQERYRRQCSPQHEQEVAMRKAIEAQVAEKLAKKLAEIGGGDPTEVEKLKQKLDEKHAGRMKALDEEFQNKLQELQDKFAADVEARAQELNQQWIAEQQAGAKKEEEPKAAAKKTAAKPANKDK